LRASGVYSGADAGDDTFVRTFAILNREIERMFQTRTSPVPIERTLLTTLATASWMHAVTDQPGRIVATPQLALAYDPIES
jgi:hypothetical protein